LPQFSEGFFPENKVKGRTVPDANESQAPFNYSARQAHRVGEIYLVFMKKFNDSLVWVIFGRSEYQGSSWTAFAFFLRACDEIERPRVF
jgi:hypothetical protein